ncbi:MAG: hypothetical protein F6K28_33605 [Microcoleus sp. SIO2G3]|nr:hypothetical protein [Microcoleus sp. SIO2G3]
MNDTTEVASNPFQFYRTKVAIAQSQPRSKHGFAKWAIDCKEEVKTLNLL